MRWNETRERDPWTDDLTAAEKSKTEPSDDCLVVRRVELCYVAPTSFDIDTREHCIPLDCLHPIPTPFSLCQHVTSLRRVWLLDVPGALDIRHSNAAERNPATRYLIQQHIRLDTRPLCLQHDKR